MSKALLVRILFVLSIILIFSGVSQAVVTVSDPTVDTITQGDWQNKYGCCFFLLPDATYSYPEEDVGPDYSLNNCYGGWLYDNDVIDWRIFRINPITGLDVSAKSCILSDDLDPNGGRAWGAPALGGAQWNPCRTEEDYWASTWDSEQSSFDPLVMELNINFVGSIRIAYYFINSNKHILEGVPVCRSQTLTLYINDEEKTTYTVSDFAAGKYVVFELEGLNGATKVTLKTSLVTSPGECNIMYSDPEQYVYGVNAHLSGVFIDCAGPLQVTKTCQVDTPTPGDFECKKPIDELTMIWAGTENIRIKAYKGPVGSELLADINNIAPDDEVTVSGYAGSPNDVIWEIFRMDGVKYGESIFHLSCSDDGMNDPGDCGDPQGDGKDKSGYINHWIFEGMVSAGGTLNCTPEPSEQTSECEFVDLFPPSCETEGKPMSLTFEYTGGGCLESKNDQGSKAKCTGEISIDPVSVIATDNKGKKDYIIESVGLLSLGEEFTITPGSYEKFSSELVIILDSNEKNKIHVSCSQPLEVGDVFGSLTLVAINGERLGQEVTYKYEVTNSGSVDVNDVTVVDNMLIDLLSSPIDQILPGESEVLMATTFVSETTTNTVEVTGVFDFSVDWPAELPPCIATAEAQATVTVLDPPKECTTKVRAMLLQYIGPDINEEVTVYIKADKIKNEIVTFYYPEGLTSDTLLTPNGWTIDAAVHDKNELGSKVKIYINDEEEVIHTSCSTPFVAGAPAPLDKPKGDPSNNWLVVDFEQK